MRFVILVFSILVVVACEPAPDVEAVPFTIDKDPSIENDGIYLANLKAVYAALQSMNLADAADEVTTNFPKGISAWSYDATFTKPGTSSGNPTGAPFNIPGLWSNAVNHIAENNNFAMNLLFTYGGDFETTCDNTDASGKQIPCTSFVTKTPNFIGTNGPKSLTIGEEKLDFTAVTFTRSAVSASDSNTNPASTGTVSVGYSSEKCYVDANNLPCDPAISSACKPQDCCPSDSFKTILPFGNPNYITQTTDSKATYNDPLRLAECSTVAYRVALQKTAPDGFINQATLAASFAKENANCTKTGATDYLSNNPQKATLADFFRFVCDVDLVGAVAIPPPKDVEDVIATYAPLRHENQCYGPYEWGGMTQVLASFNNFVTKEHQKDWQTYVAPICNLKTTLQKIAFSGTGQASVAAYEEKLTDVIQIPIFDGRMDGPFLEQADTDPSVGDEFSAYLANLICESDNLHGGQIDLEPFDISKPGQTSLYEGLNKGMQGCSFTSGGKQIAKTFSNFAFPSSPSSKVNDALKKDVLTFDANGTAKQMLADWKSIAQNFGYIDSSGNPLKTPAGFFVMSGYDLGNGLPGSAHSPEIYADLLSAEIDLMLFFAEKLNVRFMIGLPFAASTREFGAFNPSKIIRIGDFPDANSTPSASDQRANYFACDLEDKCIQQNNCAKTFQYTYLAENGIPGAPILSSGCIPKSDCSACEGAYYDQEDYVVEALQVLEDKSIFTNKRFLGISMWGLGTYLVFPPHSNNIYCPNAPDFGSSSSDASQYFSNTCAGIPKVNLKNNANLAPLGKVKTN